MRTLGVARVNKETSARILAPFCSCALYRYLGFLRMIKVTRVLLRDIRVLLRVRVSKLIW